MGLLRIHRIALLRFGVPLLVIVSSIAIALSPLLIQFPQIAIGITYDLALTAPLLYFLFIRKSSISKLSVVPVFILGIVLGTWLLPEEQQNHLNLIKTFVLPAVELLVLAVLTMKIHKGIKIFKHNSTATADFHALSKKSTREVFGNSKLSAFLYSEISMFYYALLSWKRNKRSENEFTNYKENASIALACALLMVVFIETYALHVLLLRWSTVAAWILTATSVYTAIMILAHIKALLQRSSMITDKQLILKNGLIADIVIDINEIKRIALFSGDLVSDEIKIGNLGLSKESKNHNVAIYFHRPQTIEKMYGSTVECDVLLFHIDEKTRFLEQVKCKL